MNIQDYCVGLKGVISSIHKVTKALSGTTNSTTISSAIDEVATAIENGGGGGGTTDHTKLINRDSDNQHPINAIEGLSEELDGKQDKLISGDNIVTINNQSLLGDGNLDVSDIFIAHYGDTTYRDILSILSSKLILVREGGRLHTVARSRITYSEIVLSTAPDIDLEDNEIACWTFKISNRDVWAMEYDSEYYQEELTSGTNIKTINNISILGSGDIDLGAVFVAEYDVTSYTDIETAIELNKAILVRQDGYLSAPLEYYKSGGDIILRQGLTSDGNEMTEFFFKISPQSVWSVESSTTELQQLLVSGTNIKTINNKSILGSGNVDTTILESPNGTQYKLKVANDGTLSTEVI